MKRQESKNANNKTKTYTVYQSLYTYGYMVADTEDFRPNEDIHEYFEAEEGDEWLGTVVLSIFTKTDEIESKGYDMADVEKMDDDELLEMLKNVLPEDRFYDWDGNIACICGCDEDYEPGYIRGYDRDVDEDYGVDVDCELKCKFTLEGGEVKREIVW